jgi:hypothetical protein
LRVVFQDLSHGKSALGEAREAVTRLDDTGSAANQLTRPRVVARQNGQSAVVLFEDDRSGFSRVRVTDSL